MNINTARTTAFLHKKDTEYSLSQTGLPTLPLEVECATKTLNRAAIMSLREYHSVSLACTYIHSWLSLNCRPEPMQMRKLLCKYLHQQLNSTRPILVSSSTQSNRVELAWKVHRASNQETAYMQLFSNTSELIMNPVFRARWLHSQISK